MSLTTERLTDSAGPSPKRGTYPIAADVRIFGGGLTCIDIDGRAVPGGHPRAVLAVGRSSATYDNRAPGSELGGGAGVTTVEVEFGTFGWANHRTGTPAADEIGPEHVGRVAYVVDDETVSLSDDGGARIVAGLITEVRAIPNVAGTKRVYVFMGPHVASHAMFAGSVWRDLAEQIEPFKP